MHLAAAPSANEVKFSVTRGAVQSSVTVLKVDPVADAVSAKVNTAQWLLASAVIHCDGSPVHPAVRKAALAGVPMLLFGAFAEDVKVVREMLEAAQPEFKMTHLDWFVRPLVVHSFQPFCMARRAITLAILPQQMGCKVCGSLVSGSTFSSSLVFDSSPSQNINALRQVVFFSSTPRVLPPRKRS